MKKLALVFLFGLFSQFVFSQSVSLVCPNNVEVGIPVQCTATFNDGGKNLTVKGYEWLISSLGGVGESNIRGSINGQNKSSLEVATTSKSNTIRVIWGDAYEFFTPTVLVTVVYIDESGKEDHEQANLSWVNVLNVLPPDIYGPSVQDCCTRKVKYCDGSSGNQDRWQWSVSGGNIVSGQGSKCIWVKPNSRGSLTISSVASRENGLTKYTRKGTKHVKRTQPQTNEIKGPSIVCKGQAVRLCSKSLCGMSGVHWNVPATFSIVSGQGTPCVEIVSNSTAGNGIVSNITAQAQFSDGCTAIVSKPHKLTHYSWEIPPPPNGYPYIIFDDDYQGCRRMPGSYRFGFSSNTPYLNGKTTVSPGVVIDVPHHNVDPVVELMVCNYNYCSKKSYCKTYTVTLPPFCDMDRSFRAFTAERNQFDTIPQIQFTDSGNRLNKVDIEIFPNPTISNTFSVKSNTPLNGHLTIRNIYGKILVEKTLYNIVYTNIDISKITENGIYHLTIKDKAKMYTHKLIVNK